MDIGIIGLPNVGKSTLFNALTGGKAAVENFPFTTIEPNIGIVPLLDSRLSALAERHGSAKTTPAAIRFVDIAGLVQGASQGEGLGNKFLSHIKSVDAIAQVVRCFHDEDVASTLSEFNPVTEVEIIAAELSLADLQQAQTALERYAKPAKSGDAEAKVKADALNLVIHSLNNNESIRTLNLDQDIIREFQFLTAKPVMFIANIGENQVCPDMLAALHDKAARQKATVIPLCAKLELEIQEFPLEERQAYYEDADIAIPGFSRLAQAGKELLKLICFYTTNENETRAWLIPQGTKAVKAAGKIHTDMENGFIRAEVFQIDDYLKYGSESALREKGLLAVEGKDYEVRDGDVMLFRFHA